MRLYEYVLRYKHNWRLLEIKLSNKIMHRMLHNLRDFDPVGIV